MSDKDKGMQSLARLLDTMLNGAPGQGDRGFVLLVLEPNSNHGSDVTYVSNVDQNTRLAALKEIVARFEGQPEQVGHA